MKLLLSSLLFIVALSFMIYLTIVLQSKRGEVKVYDCSLAEISPDYPIEVKNGCRKLRMEKK
jgi:hypothetical protein